MYRRPWMTNTNLPLLSVVTAAHPRDRRFLEDAYRSLDEQTERRWEWVIQEDGGRSDLSRWATRDDRISYASNGQQLGVAATRNLACFRAKASILRNLDCDDMLASTEVVGYTLETFESRNIDYLVGPMLDLSEDGSVKSFDEVLAAGPINPGVLFEAWCRRGRNGVVHPTSLAIRSSAFARFGPYPAVFHGEDTAFLLPLSQVCAGWFADRPVAIHRKRASSLTGSFTAEGSGMLELVRDFTEKKSLEMVNRHDN